MTTAYLNPSGLDCETIRHFIYDRTAADKTIDMDLTWSDDEIARAMHYCALSFNALPPFAERVSATTLPNDIVFIHGTVYHLYLSLYSKLIHNNLDYVGGNMTVDRTKRLINHLEKAMALHKAEFETLGKLRKLNKNLSSAYGYF